jgi:hypothetical protein
MSQGDEIWAPEVCTLPTVDRPLRLAEFDDLFATALRGQRRLSPQVLRWSLDPEAEDAARDLTARETQCCSFFSFDVTAATGAELVVEVTVPPAHSAVLDALAARAARGAT